MPGELRGRHQRRCESCREYHFSELKPQKTGTGLLIRHGEVATTSGSTNSRVVRRVETAGSCVPPDSKRSKP